MQYSFTLIKGLLYLLLSLTPAGFQQYNEDVITSPPPEPLQTYELPVIKTHTSDNEPCSLTVSISLAFSMDKDPELKQEIESRQDEICHMINIILAGKRYEDLDSVDDKVNLAEEIRTHLNVLLKKGGIREIYYKRFLVE